MIDHQHQLSITRQAELVGISRGSVYYLPASIDATELALMQRIDRLHLEHPFMGARMLRDTLNRERDAEGASYPTVGRKHVTTLMQRMGINALYRKPGTSTRQPGHKIYPYLASRDEDRAQQSGLGARHHVQYAQPTSPARRGVKLLEHVWNAVPDEVDIVVMGLPFLCYERK